ncbi:MAG: PAS domain S-box protein [Kiritimatiellae bacterium]|nr:PAS domain S-box protein [Kiritimatiellia bacterium]
MKTQSRVIAFYFLLGLVVWFLSALLHYYTSYEGSFWSLLLADPSSGELCVRSVILACFLLFGLLMSRAELRRERAQAEIRRLNEELSRSVEQRTAELARTSDELQQRITQHLRAEEAVALSEERFRQFFENEPEYCYMVSPDGIVLDVNKAALRVLGYSKEELVGKPVATIYAPESQAQAREVVETWKQTGVVQDREMTVLTKRGEHRTVLLSAGAVRDGSGLVVHSVSVQKDITERKLAEAAQRESEERYRLLVENLNAVVCSLDAEGIIRYISPAAQALFGFPPEEIVGHSHVLLAHPSDRPSLERHITGVFRGADVSAEHRIITRAGDVRWVRLSCRLVRDGERVAGASGFFMDVTARKEAEEHSEKLLAGLTAVIGAANQLMRCESFDELLRSAVEVARDRLGVERCGIFLHDGQVVRGTYGTNLQGKTTDERTTVAESDPHWEEVFSAAQNAAPRCWVKQSTLTEWNGSKGIDAGLGWVAHTAIGQRGQRPAAVLCNDTAISGRPLDSTQQQVISLYCSFLATLFEHKRVDEALRASESRFRVFAELLPQVVYEATTDGRITFVNRSAYRLFGYTPEDVAAGFSGLSIFAPEDVPTVKRNLQRLLAGEELGGDEYTAVTKDGRRFPVIVYSSRIVREGKTAGMRGILVDITERKQAEQKIERLVQGLRAVVKAADQLIRCDTLDELYRRAVEVARADLGLERCAIFVKDNDSIRGTYGTNMRGETTDERQRAWREERGEWDEIFAATQGSDPQWWLKDTTLTEWDGTESRPAGPGWVAFTAIAEAGTKPIGMLSNDTGISHKPIDPTQQEIVSVYCSFLADVIERKRVEEALRQATEDAEIANRLKSQILANVSHEVRTPLNSIIGFTEQMLASESMDTVHGHARTVLREGLNLLSIINTILEHARIEAGTLELRSRPLELRHVIESASGLAGVGARDKGLAFAVSVAQGVPVYVVGDALRLHQVLTNLLDNAVKFTKRGSISLIVETATPASGTADIRFSVTDTGIGIPERQQATIFESFMQADGSTTRQFRGVGLGLTIARQLVRLMGGEIGFQSTPGKGSTFWFTLKLPVSPTPPEPEDLVLLPEGHPALADEAVAPAHVLLAEDYAPNREITRLVLESAGHNVDVVTNGAKAVAACEKGTFDLILLDVHMPGMDGLEAARLIRAGKSASSQTPILALTASADPETRETCRQAGMNGIITKPIRRDPFLAAVGRWASGRPGPSETEAGAAQPVSGGTAAPPALDYEQAVREFGGNRALAERVISDFLSTAQIQLRRLREALTQREARILNREAHRIRGAAANLTAMPLAEAARRLEELAASDALAGAEESVKDLEREFAALKKAFASARKNGRKQRK